MSPRGTAWLAIATVVLAVGVWWSEQGHGGGLAEGGRVFPGVDPAAVESLAWDSPDGRVRAARSGGGWQIVEPLEAPADSAGLDSAARSLRDLTSAGSVDEPAEPSVYGLAEASTRITFVLDGRELWLSLGQESPLGGAVYAAAAERPGEVLLIPVEQASRLDRGLEDLRDRRVLDFLSGEVTRLRIAARAPEGGFEATLERGGEDGGWRIVAPAAFEADGAAVERLLSDLSLLRADRFVDEPGRRERKALDEPALVAEVQAGERRQRLELAASGGGDSLRLVRGREGRVYLVRDALVSHLPTRLFALRSKAVARFDPGSVRTLEVETREGDAFQGPAGEDLLQALATLDATEVVAEALGDEERAALGLDPPRLRVRVQGEGRMLLADLAFGRRDARHGLFVQRNGSETVFAVDPGLETELPFEPNDLAGATAGKAANAVR